MLAIKTVNHVPGTFLALLLCTCALFCISCRDTKTVVDKTSPDTTSHKYPIRSGIVTIESSMMGIKQTLYFDDFGAREATYTSAKSGDTITSAVRVRANGELIEYNEQTRRGRRRMDSAALTEMPQIDKLTEQQKKDFHITDLEDREYLGRNCKGYQMDYMGAVTKTWVWGNISMYAESVSDKGTVTMRVTSLETDIDVPSDKFAVPSDIAFVEQPSIPK